MPFDPSKDKTLKAWQCDDTGLIVSINQYDNGQPKLQIGPRMVQKKGGGPAAPAKAGRLSYEEVRWLADQMDDIIDLLGRTVTPE